MEFEAFTMFEEYLKMSNFEKLINQQRDVLYKSIEPCFRDSVFATSVNPAKSALGNLLDEHE